MKIPKEEKEQMVQKIKAGEISVIQAAQECGVSRRAVYKWLNPPSKDKKAKTNPPTSKKKVEIFKKDKIDISVYQNMTKDELIDELILAKANELRAKKGYEVRGVGANKEFVILNNKNSK